MEKDKEILLSKDFAKWLADILAKCLMPDTIILSELPTPSGDVEISGDRWVYKIKKEE